MASNHSFLIAAACALPLSLLACSDSAEEKIIPEGTHYGYVVSKVSVPTTMPEVNQFGLDLGSRTSSKPDGPVDNALGNTLFGLKALMFDIQATVTTAVDTGSILLLIDFQTKDFMTSNAAGFGVKIGANPVPAPCVTPTDCRHHLNGMGMFSIAANSPTDALLGGKITSGTFKGGPGDIALQIAIGSTTAITLNLLHARVQATSITETGLTAIIGGLVTQEELTTQIGPAIVTSVGAIIERDCPVPVGGARVPPTCSCTGTGLTVINALDGDLASAGGPAPDCKVTLDEVLGQSLVKTLLQPDSCSAASCAKADSLSIGIKVEAVKATFPM